MALSLLRGSAEHVRLAGVAGVTRLADVTGLDDLGVPVHLAIRPSARSLVVSVGKSLDPVRACVGALMESVETWHAENLELPTLTGTVDELRAAGYHPLDLRGLPQECDCAANLSARTDWVEGANLVDGGVLRVPAELVSMDFTPRRPAPLRLPRSSNGLAAGETVHGALLHALCEVIERDAEFRWRRSDDSRRIRLASVRDAGCRELLARLARARVGVAAWDVTSHLGVPCVGAIIVGDPGGSPWRPAGAYDGFACHPEPATALRGALVEAVQKRLTYISGSRDDLSREELDRVHDPALVDAVYAEVRDAATDHELPTRSPLAGTRDVEWTTEIVDRLRRSGHRQVAVVDLTRPDLGLPVVKVIVPWLEGPYGLCEPVTSGAD